jgi:hypothetical protein
LDSGSRVGSRAIERLREPPVDDPDLVRRADDQVGRLQVAVDDAARVRVRHDVAGREQDAQRASERPAIAARARELEDLLERAPLAERHREVDLAARIGTEVVDRDDAGVLQLPGDARLREEALEDRVRLAGVPRQRLRVEHLHRDRALEHRVPHAQDDAHAAARHLAEQHVARPRPLTAQLRARAGDARNVELRVRALLLQPPQARRQVGVRLAQLLERGARASRPARQVLREQAQRPLFLQMGHAVLLGSQEAPIVSAMRASWT